MNDFSIKEIKEEKIHISENETKNQYKLSFESSEEGVEDKTITLYGKGSLKTVVSV